MVKTIISLNETEIYKGIDQTKITLMLFFWCLYFYCSKFAKLFLVSHLPTLFFIIIFFHLPSLKAYKYTILSEMAEW